MENLSSIGKRIRHLRTERKLSRQKLADLIKSYPANIAAWEADINVPYFKNIKTLSDIFNVSIHWLQTGEGTMSKRDNDEFSATPHSGKHKDLGGRIAMAISDVSKSSRAVAKAMEIDPSTLYRYISGDIGPSYAVLQQVVKHTKCDPAWLLMGPGHGARNFAIPAQQPAQVKPVQNDPFVDMLLKIKELDQNAFLKLVGEIAMAYSRLAESKKV